MPTSKLVLRKNKAACLRSIAQDTPNVTPWENPILHLQDINISTGERNQLFPFPCIQSFISF